MGYGGKGVESMQTDWIAIFKTGTHTDGAGQTRTWTDQDLDRIVAQFNPAEHEPPVVVGHPATDAPAFGWVAAVKRDGALLYARLKDLVPEFVDLLKEGRFKKRSIALYPDLTLRHVGFLGAMPPAVKGLPDAQFAAGTFSEVSLQPEEETMDEKMKVFWQQFRELLLGGNAPIVIQQSAAPSTQHTGLSTDAAAAQFAEREKTLVDREAAIKAREEATAQATAQTARQLKAAEIHAFCEGLKQDGKLLPAWQEMGLEKFLLELPSEATHTFAEGKPARTAQAFMQSFLTALPKVVEFAEKAKVGEKDPKTGAATDKKSWAAQEYARNVETYQQLNVSTEMLEAIAPGK